MDRGRRSFFGALVGSVAAAPVVVDAVPLCLIDKGIVIQQVHCPNCLYVQANPRVSDYGTHAEWRDAILSPQYITCGNSDCRTRMRVTFGKQV